MVTGTGFLEIPGVAKETRLPSIFEKEQKSRFRISFASHSARAWRILQAGFFLIVWERSFL